MREFEISEILEGTGGSELRRGAARGAVKVTGFAVDSREVRRGDAFFALPGERTDGHRFLGAAAEAGAAVLVVSDDGGVELPGFGADEKAPEAKVKAADFGAERSEGPVVVKVPDTLAALQNMAKWYLAKLDCIKLAVTGSVGKTTTRDFAAAGLSSKYKTAKNLKNYNSGIGMPLSILSWDEDTEAAVLEMGMDGPGQIRTLAEIFRPDAAIITNIGTSHMERLGSRENIYKAKMEITEYMGSPGTLIVNGRDDMLDGTGGDFDIIRAGTERYVITDEEDHGTGGISFRLDGEKVSLPFPGIHNAMNTALAVAAGELFGAERGAVIEKIKAGSITGNRMKVTHEGGITVIDDSYNAAPASMMSAIGTLGNSAGRKIAYLGDMNELGADSEKDHYRTGLAAGGIDIVVAVGKKAEKIAEGARDAGAGRVICAETAEDADISFVKKGDTVLLKASRSMELEKIGERIRKITG